MRLLNVYTLELEEFIENDIPEYCILSHRWTSEELSYKEFIKRRKTSTPDFQKTMKASLKKMVSEKTGYQKISDFCYFVKGLHSHDIGWVWIDTICIDKRSSSELSEAINSMFAWYQNAKLCVAYLNDVFNGPDWKDQFERSEWFTRGWTLQELIAPKSGVLFCDARWRILGQTLESRMAERCVHAEYGPCLNDIVSRLTSVDHLSLVGFLHNGAGGRLPLATRMSWISKRKTTRTEDIAYCLLGIFEVNMPLIYGEREKAFLRLQEEIIKRSTDQSIFLWLPPRDDVWYGMLAPEPTCFSHCLNLDIDCSPGRSEPYAVTNKGLELSIALRERTLTDRGGPRDANVSTEAYAVPLNCARRIFIQQGEFHFHRFEICLQKNPRPNDEFDDNVFFRIRGDQMPASSARLIVHYESAAAYQAAVLHYERKTERQRQKAFVPTCLTIGLGIPALSVPQYIDFHRKKDAERKSTAEADRSRHPPLFSL